MLCDLVCNSPNFKVRTNAAWALSVCNSFDKYIVTLWKSVMMGLENSQHVPSYVEYAHRDALVHQVKYITVFFISCNEGFMSLNFVNLTNIIKPCIFDE